MYSCSRSVHMVEQMSRVEGRIRRCNHALRAWCSLTPVARARLEREAAKARFAVVLMSGDDEGGLRGSGVLRTRARQNVVLEAGWFMGKLGRQNIAVLVAPCVEHPSDISGMILIPFGSGTGWRSRLRLELQASGFELDPPR